MSSEVDSYDDFPNEMKRIIDNPYVTRIGIAVYAYNAGVRAGRAGDARTLAAILYSIARIHHGVGDPIDGGVRDADALIAALAKETK